MRELWPFFVAFWQYLHFSFHKHDVLGGSGVISVKVLTVQKARVKTLGFFWTLREKQIVNISTEVGHFYILDNNIIAFYIHWRLFFYINTHQSNTAHVNMSKLWHHYYSHWKIRYPYIRDKRIFALRKCAYL